MRKLIFVLLGLSLLIGWGRPVRAQTQARADLYPADASGFPTISAFLDVWDGSGRFVSGLKAGDVAALEDGQPLPVQELNEMTIPAQIVVAINPGPPLGARDTQGVTRFQRVVEALNAWAQALPADTPDDLGLVTIAGPVISHASAKDWLVSLNAFQPDFRSTTPNLQSLAAAIETASAQTPRPGMKRAILFITPRMDDPNVDTLIQPLIERAIQNRIVVFVWFVDADLYAATTSAAAFNTLASQTGGAYFSATATPVQYPNPDSYFAPLRRIYSLKYNSAVVKGGSHTFSVDIQSPVGGIRSNEQSFSVNIQPPNPIFVSPPLQIVRRAPEDDPYNDKVLVPATQTINIIVEFPDGYKRSLVRTTLYVDGQIAAENKTAPFDAFTWDLGSYTLSGDHKIMVEAVDAMGQSKTSMEIPVTVTVIQPPRGAAAFFGRYRQYITVGAVSLAGLVLLLIVFMGSLRALLFRSRAARQAQGDPLTQPVPAVVEAPVAQKATKRGRSASAKAATKRRVEAPAYLQRLTSDLEAAPVKPIPLSRKEITFGADPVQSTNVLDDPSLAPRHARLTQSEDGNYLLSDAGTVAGTWINFEPIGKESRRLQHGDVVHFGQLAFRFELKNPPTVAEPKITKENPSA